MLQKLDRYFQDEWGCGRAGHFQQNGTESRMYTWKPIDMLTACARIVSFFEMEGWEIQVCSQQMVKEGGQQCVEQTILFRPGRSDVGIIEPHLFLELYAGEGKEELYEEEETTQVLANQHIRVEHIGPQRCKEIEVALVELDRFILQYLNGSRDPTSPKKSKEPCKKYNCNVFLCRGRFENNLSQWTMRLCDFLVDRLGWSFIVCSLCNQGEYGNFRSQQLVFRYDGDKREVPVSSAEAFKSIDRSALAKTSLPEYWKIPAVISRQEIYNVSRCSRDEIYDLQHILDLTFKRILTRDRAPDDDAPDTEEMPYRLEVVNAFRSENAWLHHRYMQRQGRGTKGAIDKPFPVKTWSPAPMLASRLRRGDAYLLHGTNPSSAMSILQTGFLLDHAGSSRGTMFGNGIYAAECSSKSDEYGRDDGGNTYPELRAMLVCRCFIGHPLVVDASGDHTTKAKELGYDCVCGDRESKVHTYREFIFSDEAQLYPEFTVIYRRQYDPVRVPFEWMQRATTGTTGRFWQMKPGEKSSWRNVPPEVNKMLIQAKKDEQVQVNIVLRGNAYVFNVGEKTGHNTKTGNTVPLRAPMQS